MKVTVAIVGSIVAVGLAWSTWVLIMGDNAATQDRIDSIGGASENLRQQQQP